MSGVIPYLIRAYCDWIEDNKLTSATVGRTINNEAIIFKARFQGKSQKIVVPCNAVLSIYAHENGEGMMFDMPKSDQEKNDKKPSLKILD